MHILTRTYSRMYSKEQRKMKGELILAKKKKTRFQKITTAVVWVMIIATLGTMVLTAVVSVMGY